MDHSAVTQPTQLDTFDEYPDFDDTDTWGMLLPADPSNHHLPPRIFFLNTQTTYRIGRAHDNDVQFNFGKMISGHHCTIELNDDGSNEPAVVLVDMSTNGTFIDGQRVVGSLEPEATSSSNNMPADTASRGGVQRKCTILRTGSEIAFGCYRPGEKEVDYRFIFIQKTDKTRSFGLNAEYDTHRVSGRGTYGTVFKALHRAEGKWYAVKMFSTQSIVRMGQVAYEGSFTAGEIPEALKREIEIMRSINHPHICQFKEVFYAKDNISIVLEWMDGGDLLSYILNRPDNAIPEPLAQYMTYQICDALAYMHDRKIAHRDLKPENIMLTGSNPPVLKIADFGLAKLAADDTILKTFCGTSAYIAPEMGTGNVYDHLVDSWSTGVIVYAMLTGTTPYTAHSDELPLASWVQMRQIEWSSLDDALVSPYCVDFVRQLLEYNPEHRMSMSDALKHPWLAHLRPRSDGDSTSEDGAGSQTIVIASPSPEPATQPHEETPRQSAPLHSFASDRMMLDTASIVMATEPERSQTPVATADESAPSSGASSRVLSGGPSRLQRRSDIIWRAQAMGIEPLAPPQQLQPEGAMDTPEPETPAEPPIGNVAAITDTKVEETAGSPARKPPKGSKRKAVDLSSPPPDLANGHDADGSSGPVTRTASHRRRGRGGSTPSPKRPPVKRARTRATSDPAGKGDDANGGPSSVTRRRSVRIASSPSNGSRASHKG